jgi:DNA-binding XRE family transcriptional regulator
MNAKSTIDIKNNLRKYRNFYNLTQKQMAEILKVSLEHLVNIERNGKYPKYQIRSRICEYFDVNQDQMFYVENQ